MAWPLPRRWPASPWDERLDAAIGLTRADGLLIPSPRPGAGFALRTANAMTAHADRTRSRHSLTFFAQLTGA